MDDFEDIEVLNSSGEPLKTFYQWDMNQSIKIVLNGAKAGLLTIAPEVHFTNAKRQEALVMKSTVSGTDTILVDVPNLILTEQYNIQVYIYVTEGEDDSQRSIAKIDIPLVRRDKPSDSYYVETITRVRR